MAETIAMIFRKGEIRMKRIKNIIAISAFSMLVLALPSIASAQWGGNNGGYGYPNAGNNRGGYGVNLKNVADRLKDSSKDFEKQVDREFNGNNRNRNYGGGGILGTIFNGGNNRGYSNSNIKRLAEDFRKSANEFEKRADNNGRDMYRGQEAANRMLSIGSQIDRAIGSSGGYGRNSGLQYQWQAIRRDLNIVASAYGNQNRGRNGRFPF